MKNLLIISFAFSFLPATSQQLLNASSMWKQQSGYYRSYPDPYYYVEDYIIKMDGDTMISNKLYYKTLQTGTLTVTGGISDTLVGIYPIHNYLHPLREENQAFYVFDVQTKKDKLLHNFNIVPGDTATGDCDNGVVVWIDTLYLGSNARKRFHLAFPPGMSETNYLIEGVGAAFGAYNTPCNVYPPFSTYFKLQCYSQDGAYLQIDSTFDCSNIVHATDHLLHPGYSIYPNPFYEDFEIRVPGEIRNALAVTITNLTGAVVYDEKIESLNSTIQITLDDVPSGLYVLSLTSGDGISSIKIIKR